MASPDSWPALSLSLSLPSLCMCAYVRALARVCARACVASGDYLEENGCMGPRRRPRVLFCRGCITRSLLGPSHSAGRRHWGDASREPASMGRSRLQPSSPAVAVRTVRCRRCQIVITTCFLRVWVSGIHTMSACRCAAALSTRGETAYQAPFSVPMLATTQQLLLSRRLPLTGGCGSCFG